MPTDANYGTEELLAMIEPLFIPGNFLLRAFFPEVIEFDTEEVKFDRVIADRRLAPFVSPLAPGKIQQPKGYRVETIVPAYLKPKNQVTGKEVMKRLAGEMPGGAMSAGDRRDRIMLDYMFNHRQKIERRLEWMAAQILTTGAVTIVGDDYPSTVVDFSRDDDLTEALTGTSEWGDAGVSPFADVQTWIDLVGTKSGAAVNIAVMDGMAWDKFIADPRSEKALDRDLGQTAAVSLGLTPNLPGSPTFKGRIGAVEFYVYNDTYEDDAGSTAQLLPAHSVILGSQGGIEGAQMFGAILDPRNDYGPARYFPKSWIDEDPAGEFVMTQSAPILAPRRIDASFYASVKAA